jgi:hypothetical protein
MKLPELHGKLSHKEFFIYAAADEKYFDLFALPIINSIRKNTSHNFHIHIFNPRDDQIKICQDQDISYSYEYISQFLNEKTYYACARFIRLNQLITDDQNFFAIDIDAIVRKDIPMLKEKDIFIHYVPGKKARFLAGGIFSSKDFLNTYSLLLQKEIENNSLDWGLDQEILKNLVPQFKWGHLPKEYIDWEMNLNSFIWTAKGKRKDLEIFKNEQKKYSA